MATNLAEERRKNAFLAPNRLNNAGPFGVFETAFVKLSEVSPSILTLTKHIEKSCYFSMGFLLFLKKKIISNLFGSFQ